MEEERITWRSFWNGPQGTRGPISTAWNVAGWPTIYWIDHKGVIRHKFPGSPGGELLGKLIDAMLEERLRPLPATNLFSRSRATAATP